MSEPTCATHPGKTVRWHCHVCSLPLCDACGAGALDGRIYCPACLVKAQPTPATTPNASERGVGLGIGLALLLIVVAPAPAWWLFRSIPWLTFLVGNPFVTIGVAYWIARRKKRPGIAKGLLIGAVIWVSVILLLMAACFGMVLFSRFWK